ncbi:MAG: DUF87 domain-containing protein [Chloroflexi bacterium]|nr:DUF87 domain-containing protein [Chloroflexota bacterium]
MTNGLSPNGPPEESPSLAGTCLGQVVGGSLSQGVEIRLDSRGQVSVEDIKVGSFITIHGDRHRFFGVVTEIALGSSDPRLKHTPPEIDDPFIAQVISGTVAYGTVSVLPNLTMPAVAGTGQDKPVAAKTVPAHFSRAYAASEQDVATVFGEEDENHFWIGSPLDMETKVCLNLEELVKRSIGVFGKSGTGKTFLTRLLLVGIIQGGQASSLIFDMHSEYGWMGQDTDRNVSVKGLKQLFPASVSTFTLDEESSRRRGSSTDEVVRIGYGDIEPEDIQLLRETLDISEIAASAAFDLARRFGQSNWLADFLDLEGNNALNELAGEIGVQPQALAALHRRLRRFERYAFLEKKTNYNATARIIDHLEKGKHVVLEFGRYGEDLSAYILVSNLLSRRIRDRYIELKEQSAGGQGKEPHPVVIVIEEAHKFLGQAVASQTIFGTIARELRKYNVTLMVIDQRPSAIDSEVMSQLGTRLTCLLDNERDIDAALSGTPGSRQLRGVLSRLEAKQQALIFGHALPMPVVIHTREYNDAFYAQVQRGPGRRTSTATYQGSESPEERLEREINELF